jgi:hypothetical protein
MDKSGILLGFFVTLSLILAAEIFISISHTDSREVIPVLYYADGDINYSSARSIHKHVDSPLLVSLAGPINTTCLGCGHPMEDNRDTTISINSIGCRGADYPLHKKGDTFRIIIVGGSNTFGISVDDNQTYPYLLEKKLHESGKGNYEVWNCGIPAYSLLQKVEYAKLMRKYDPDILVIEDTLSNRGRRVFSLFDSNKDQLFAQDKELFVENIPPLLIRSALTDGMHNALLRTSSFYRWVAARTNNMILNKLRISSCIDAFPYTNCADKVTEGRFSQYSDNRGIESLNSFLESNPDSFVFNPVDSIYCPSDQRHFSLCNISGEYSDIHPPYYVYEVYAEELSGFIMQEKIRKI